MDGDDAAVVITVNMENPYSPYMGVPSHIMELAVPALLQPCCVYSYACGHAYSCVMVRLCYVIMWCVTNSYSHAVVLLGFSQRF